MEGLTRMGARVDSIAAYRTVPVPESKETARTLLGSGSIDLVTFTSSSTVLQLARFVGWGQLPCLVGCSIACIGPITVKAAEKAGLRVAVMAQEYTVPGLVRAMKAHFKVKSGARST